MKTSICQYTQQIQGNRIHHHVFDHESGRVGSYDMVHSKHSKERAVQRGITDDLIPLIQEYGDIIRKQGMFFYVVCKKNLPSGLPSSLRQKLNNMVLVVSGDDNTIITCYKSDNAIRHIKRKGCEYKKMAA